MKILAPTINRILQIWAPLTQASVLPWKHCAGAQYLEIMRHQYLTILAPTISRILQIWAAMVQGKNVIKRGGSRGMGEGVKSKRARGEREGETEQKKEQEGDIERGMEGSITGRRV